MGLYDLLGGGHDTLPLPEAFDEQGCPRHIQLTALADRYTQQHVFDPVRDGRRRLPRAISDGTARVVGYIGDIERSGAVYDGVDQFNHIGDIRATTAFPDSDMLVISDRIEAVDIGPDAAGLHVANTMRAEQYIGLTADGVFAAKSMETKGDIGLQATGRFAAVTMEAAREIGYESHSVFEAHVMNAYQRIGRNATGRFAAYEIAAAELDTAKATFTYANRRYH